MLFIYYIATVNGGDGDVSGGGGVEDNVAAGRV